MLFAFEYKSQGDANPLPVYYGNNDFPKETLVPITKIKPPPPPKPIAIIEVVNEEEITADIVPKIDAELTEELRIPEEEVDIEPEEAEEIFFGAELMPSYPGGIHELYRFWKSYEVSF